MNTTPETESNSKRIRRILGERAFEQLYRSIDEAAGLPNAAYWSEDWFQLEQELIFRPGWVFAGARAEIPAPGSMKPIEIAGTPIVLVHGRDGKVRAFQNVCRHRGMQLVSESCKQATLT